MDLTELSLAEAGQLIGAREVSAVEYASRLLERIATHDQLAAFITVPSRPLLAAARHCDTRLRAGGKTLGPLHGVPLAVKDNIDTADLPTTAGTPSLRGHRPIRDASVVRALRRSGALILGKTNLHELAYGVTSDNGAFGSVRNPYDPDRIAGGSSGGTAAAISARLAPGGLGTDTGGSVRIPAALCGIAGLRPTSGRYPQQGIVVVSSTRDTVGPMARTVADVAVLDAALTGTSTALSDIAELRGLRLGVIRKPFFTGVAPDLARVVEKRLKELTEHGVQLVELELPEGADELIVRAGFPIAFYETPITLRAYLAADPTAPSLDELVEQCGSSDVRQILTWILSDGKVPLVDYRAALDVYRPTLSQMFRDLIVSNRLTALVAPTTPLTAALVGVTEVLLSGEKVSAFDAYTRTTGPYSGIDWPGLTVPAGLDDRGLPIGLALDGPPGSDRTLLRIGQSFEHIFGPLPPPQD
jgi:Asp-tRNA(Asn)/Glu-tRNA(Gln) amidotransferase A subunit family amidase